MTRNEENYRIEEYKALREEQLLNLRVRTQLQLFILIGTATVLGIGLGLPNPNPYIFLIPSFFIIAVMFRIININTAVLRIGTYIRCFVEPHCPGIKWESRLEKIGRRYGVSSEPGSLSRIKAIITETTILLSWGCLVVCFFLAKIYWREPFNLFIVLAFIISVLAFTATYQLATIDKNWPKFLKLWEDVQCKEKDIDGNQD